MKMKLYSKRGVNLAIIVWLQKNTEEKLTEHMFIDMEILDQC